MPFKLWGRQAPAEPPPVAAEPPPTVELRTEDRYVSGWLAMRDVRLTDLLNDTEEVELLVPDNAAQPHVNGSSAVAAAVEEPRRSSIATDAILFAIPPVRRQSRQMEVHRRQRRLALTLGSLQLTGNVHVIPGSPVEAYLVRQNRKFIPLTDVVITDPADPDDRHADVVIMNLDWVSSIETLT